MLPEVVVDLLLRRLAHRLVDIDVGRSPDVEHGRDHAGLIEAGDAELFSGAQAVSRKVDPVRAPGAALSPRTPLAPRSPRAA